MLPARHRPDRHALSSGTDRGALLRRIAQVGLPAHRRGGPTGVSQSAGPRSVTGPAGVRPAETSILQVGRTVPRGRGRRRLRSVERKTSLPDARDDAFPGAHRPPAAQGKPVRLLDERTVLGGGSRSGGTPELARPLRPAQALPSRLRPLLGSGAPVDRAAPPADDDLPHPYGTPRRVSPERNDRDLPREGRALPRRRPVDRRRPPR